MLSHGEATQVAVLITLLILPNEEQNPMPGPSASDRVLAYHRKGHAERAAINTPIQGSAADVAASAMVAISRCPELKAMGWKLLMQVRGVCGRGKCGGWGFLINPCGSAPMTPPDGSASGP